MKAAGLRMVVLVAAAMTPVVANAMNCGDPPERLSKDIIVETKGKVSSIGKLVGGELSNQTQVLTKDTLRDYPNADRVVVSDMLITLFCQVLRDSTSLSDTDKLDRFSIFSKQVMDVVRTAPERPEGLTNTLQDFYIAIDQLLYRPLPKNITDAEFQQYENEVNAWVNSTADWIGQHLGVAAKARFLDRSGMMNVGYAFAVNEKHNQIILSLTRLKENLRALVESTAWDRR